jgi:1,2-diacylglycerol 3-beta-galactosyltransferase
MNSKKRILVLSADAGFGHRSASRALVAAIESAHGQDCEVILSNPLDSPKTPSWLREVQTDYDRIARELPRLYKLGYDLSDTNSVSRLAENALRVLLFRSLREILHQTKPELIISTYPLYQAPLGTIFALEGCAVPLVCVVTDLVTVHASWFSDEADLTIVPTPVVRDLALAAGLESGCVEVIGIPVHPKISSETRNKEDIRRELGWDPSRVTFLAVGSKRVGRLPEALNALNHSGLPIQLAIAAGGDEALYARLSATKWHLPVKLYNFVDTMPTMMRAADAMISKAGGLVVTESLAAGLPLVLIDALPGQEIGNAEFVVSGGAGEMALDPMRCLEVVFHWLEGGGKLLREASDAARGLGRPRAAFDIVERGLSLARAGACPEVPRSRGAAAWGQVKESLQELFKKFGESWED